MLSKHTCYSILNYGSAFLRSDLVWLLLLVFVMGIADGENVSPWRTRVLNVSFSGFFIQKGFEMLTRLYVKMHPGVCWCTVFLFTICMSLNSELIGGLAPASPVEGPFISIFTEAPVSSECPMSTQSKRTMTSNCRQPPKRYTEKSGIGFAVPSLWSAHPFTHCLSNLSLRNLYIFLITLHKKGASHFLFLLSNHSSCCRL